MSAEADAQSAAVRETFEMRAIRVHRFGPLDVMVWETTPEPAVAAGQVLVRVAAAGVNPVDTYIRAGTYGPRDFPFTPGMDAAGTVEDVGAGVPRELIGRRVWVARSISGTYAELALCDANQVRPLPDRLTFSQGAGVFVPYASAWRSIVHRARTRAGEWVLVHGASGGVDLAAVQILKALGARIIGTAGTERGRQLVLQAGAHAVLDHTTPAYADEARRLTGYPEGGVGVVLEMLANVNLQRDLELLAPGGRVVVIGNRGTIEINPRLLMSRDSSVMGMSLANVPTDEMAEVFAALDAGLAVGTLTPVVGREMPMRDAPRAHEAVMSPGAAGKIVLVP